MQVPISFVISILKYSNITRSACAHAGESGRQGLLHPGPKICGGVPDRPGAADHYLALRPGQPPAQNPAGDRRRERHFPQLCIPH